MRWFQDRTPKKGDIGYRVYYKAPISHGKYKGYLSKWTGSGKTFTRLSEAKEYAKNQMGFIPKTMVRKVRFSQARISPLKSKYMVKG